MAQKVHLVIDQGTDFSSSISVEDENSEPIDISSNTYSFRGQIRKTYESSSSANLTLTGTNEGKLIISFSANSSANLAAGRYVYDVVMTDPANNTIRLVEGLVNITPRVTR